MCQCVAMDLPQTHTEPDEVPGTGVATDARLRAALDVALGGSPGPLVLAISGGCDSMALLFAMARWAPHRVAAVATYDHGTGDFATQAASLVAAEGRRLGLNVVRERSRRAGTSEAAWRAERWQFLHRVARAFRARVATAHTRDDQVETVVMRLLRGAGARGLAGLAAPSPIVRPWLALARADVGAWARAERLPWIDDPTNATPQFQRGRIRHDLLPTLETAHPGFSDAMLAVGDRAAAWRRDVESLLETMNIEQLSPGCLRVAAAPFEHTTAAGRAVLWAAVFARVGVALDARGTELLVRFTNGGRRGAHVSLAGGAVAARIGVGGRDAFEIRRAPVVVASEVGEWTGSGATLPARWRGYRFRRVGRDVGGDRAGEFSDASRWGCALEADVTTTVRCWNAGDRICTESHPAGRRVTRYFAEAGVPALDRSGWPVVLQESKIVWVPGVCRAVAVPNRPGRPDLIWYRCERERD